MTTAGRTVLAGTFWTVLNRWGVRLLGLLSTVVLARLLTPDDFGLVAISAMFLGLFHGLTNLNLTSTLISLRSTDPADYNTAFTLQFLRSLLVAGLLALVSGPVARYYEEPGMQAILLALAGAQLIAGLVNIGIVDFLKELNYRRDALYYFSAKLLSVTAAISAGIVLRSYWALVVGIVSLSLANLLLSYGLSPYRPRFSLARTRQIFGFGRWLVLHEFLSFIGARADILILGKTSGTYGTALYSTSTEIANLSTTELAMPVARAGFPVYAQLAEKPAELRELFESKMAALCYLTMPMAAGVAMTADQMILLMLGQQWVEAIPLLRILAICGLFTVLFSSAHVVYLALKKPHLSVLMGLTQIGIKLPALFLGIALGELLGAAYAVTFSAAAVSLLTFAVLTRLGVAGWSSFAARIWRAASATGLMVLALGAGQPLWQIEVVGLLMATLLEVGAGMLAYATSLWLLWQLCGRPDGMERNGLRLLAELGSRIRR